MDIVNLSTLINMDASNVEKYYGIKASDLATLVKALEQIDFSSIGIDYPVIVPDFFAIPIDYELRTDDMQLKSHFFNLTKELYEQKIIIARSSDPNEMPGKFESHTSLYDPNNLKNSFRDFVESAKKVRESGAKAVIVQVMKGNLSEFIYDIKYLQNSANKPKKIECFGSENIALYMNSRDVVLSNYPSIAACFGLGSKIARGDLDISLISKNEFGLRYVNFEYNYHRSHASDYIQNAIDVIMPKFPDVILSQKVNQSSISWPVTVIHEDEIPFGEFYCPENFKVFNLFKLIKQFKLLFNQDFQIEASLDSNSLDLLQLRFDYFPELGNKISEVEQEKILFSNNSIYGNLFYRGDIEFYSSTTVEPRSNNFICYTGNITDINPGYFTDCKRVIFEPAHHIGHSSAHVFGYTMQFLYRLKQMGIEATAIPGISSLKKFADSNNKINNVVLECGQGKAQIYRV